MDIASMTLTGLFVWSSVATSSALTQQANVPAVIEPVAPLTVEDPAIIKKLVEGEFGRGHIMVQIARCESQYRQFVDGNVLRGKVNKKDAGIFQINEGYHLAIAKKMEIDIHTIEGNLAYARHLYETKGTAPWKWSKPCWGK
ncbi:MAG: hypothetical protein WA021_01575 [Minisyncoccia bacterium]